MIFGRKRLRMLSESHGDERGAVLVEFAMAIVPVLAFFFGTIQFCAAAYVNLILHHGAFVAARCEAVVHPAMPDSGGAQDCTDAVNLLLSTSTKAKATVKPTLAAKTAQTLDVVEVDLEYPCEVPLGNVVACGKGKKLHMIATASFPNQGSAYQPIWGY
jgi:hypothetical protein